MNGVEAHVKLIYSSIGYSFFGVFTLLFILDLENTPL